jgi:hypothetical protein
MRAETAALGAAFGRVAGIALDDIGLGVAIGAAAAGAPAPRRQRQTKSARTERTCG